MKIQKTMVLVATMAAGLAWLAACGDDDTQIQHCENACDRVYANTSDGGCQQTFRHDGSVIRDAEECVDTCYEDDQFMMGAEACIADESQVSCQSQATEMINICLAEQDFDVDACDHLDAWGHQEVAMEQEVVEIVNEVRAEGVTCTGTGAQMPAVDPVTSDPFLQCAARLHSVNMVETGEFAHEIGGEGPGDRASHAGYQWSTVGENIAQGQPTAQDVVGAWVSSDQGHCENLMSGDFENIGMGVVFDGSTPWWTQKFGTHQ